MAITDSYIAKLTNGILSAQAEGDLGRTKYLQALIEGAQDELGDKGQTTPVQMAALAVAHERFYKVVLETVSKVVPRAQKDRAVELHRRANFARTALSAVRAYVRAGNDLAVIKPEKATKRTLAVRAGPRKPLSAQRLKTRADAQGKTLIETLESLAKLDAQAAADELEILVVRLTAQLEALAPQPAPTLAPVNHGRRQVIDPSRTEVLRAQRAS